MESMMHQPQDTLRHLRNRHLLRYSRLLWVASAVLGIVCLATQSLGFGAQVGRSVLLVLLAVSGLVLVTVGREHLKSHPSWNPTAWVGGLALLHALMWGYQARMGGGCLTLAVAFAGLAGIAFFTHWRLFLISWTPVAVMPILVDGPVTAGELMQLHIPLMAVIVFGFWQGHRMSIRMLENALESRHLTDLLARHRDQLEETVSRRTAELEQSNNRLNDEVELRKQINQSLVKSEEQVNMAMAAGGIGFWDWDIANRRVYHSDKQKFFGHSTQDSDYIDLESRVLKADQPRVRRALMLHLKDRTRYYHARYRIVNLDNEGYTWLEDSGKVIERDAGGRPLRMVGTRRDITDDMRNQEELRLSSSLFNNSPDGVFVLDGAQRLRTCNRVFSQMFQQQKGQLIGLPLFQVIPTEQQERIAQGMVNNGRWQGDIVALRKGHQRFPMRLTLTAIRDTEGRISHYLGIVRDLSDQRRNALQLDYLNNYDRLTGLVNRGYFHQLIKQFEEHDPLLVNHYAIAVLNLDQFKSVNDRLGQEIGDQLLKDVAARLNNLNDPVRHVARLGSDEFALYIDYEGNRAALEEVLALALEEVSRPSLIDDHELIVTASIGVTIVHHSNMRQLLNQAISAMNQARQQGGNAIQYYRPDLVRQPEQRERLELSLKQAVEDGDLTLDYQPKLNLATGLIDSVEALVRWHHPEQGPIAPEEFLPLAEDLGLIDAISNQVLQRACDDAAHWRHQGLGDISISVNLSSQQVLREDLVDRVRHALNRSGLPAEYLELEITESVLMEDVAHAQECLNRLRALGVQLALDDFGTGYSSLSYLKRLPIDTLKIDRSFLREVRDHGSSPVIEAIMAMADSLNMSVLAEGVETREQLGYLKQRGCDYAQGFLISRPLPSDDILPLIRHSNLRLVTEARPDQLH